MKLLWLEEYLNKAGLLNRKSDPIKYEHIEKLHHDYAALERYDAWQDFQRKLTLLRASIVTALLTGTDTGQGHDDEKRAVLTFLDTILSIAPNAHRQFTELSAKKEEQERKSTERLDSLHGDDVYYQRQ